MREVHPVDFSTTTNELVAVNPAQRTNLVGRSCPCLSQPQSAATLIPYYENATPMKTRSVYHADHLRRAAGDPPPGQGQPEKAAHEVNGHPEWEVSEILNSKITRGRLYYQTSWVGYDPDTTWYPASNFINAATKVDQYHRAYPDKPGPPKRLPEWLQAEQDDQYLDPTEEDDVPAIAGQHKTRMHV